MEKKWRSVVSSFVFLLYDPSYFLLTTDFIFFTKFDFITPRYHICPLLGHDVNISAVYIFYPILYHRYTLPNSWIAAFRGSIIRSYLRPTCPHPPYLFKNYKNHFLLYIKVVFILWNRCVCPVHFRKHCLKKAEETNDFLSQKK